MPALLKMAILGLLGIIIFSCSLRPVQPVTIQFGDAARLRDNPELSAMSYFAIAISGELSNTVAALQVGNRSLTCLNLVGQVSFPFSLNALLAGAQITLTPGTYRFTILGFANAAGSAPSSIAQLYSQSPTLKAYVIAQGDGNTATSTSVTLNSTYVASTATDLMVSCPVPTTGLYTYYKTATALHYLKYSQGSWSSSLETASTSQDGLFVNSQGVADLSSYNEAGDDGIHYATNQSGSFVGAPNISSNTNAPSDITRTSDDNLLIFTLPLGASLNARLYQRTAPFVWTESSNILTSATIAFPHLLLRSGPDNRLLVGAWHDSLPNNALVRARDANGVWDGVTTLTTAGGLSCTNGTTNLQGLIDSLGKSHIIFNCHLGPATSHVGYATNRSGSWETKDPFGVVFTNLGDLGFDIDSNGNLHVIYVSYNTLYRAQGSSIQDIWQGAEEIFVSAVNLLDVSIAVVSLTVQHILVVQENLGVSTLLPVTNQTGSWVVGSEITGAGATGITLGRVLYAR